MISKNMEVEKQYTEILEAAVTEIQTAASASPEK